VAVLLLFTVLHNTSAVMQSEELEEPENSDLVGYLTEHHEEQLKEVQKCHQEEKEVLESKVVLLESAIRDIRGAMIPNPIGPFVHQG
jgi:hypothetical protein